MVKTRKTIETYECTCERCGYTWTSQVENPIKCGKCQTKLWNTPKKIAKSNTIKDNGEGITKDGGAEDIPISSQTPSNSENKAQQDEDFEIDEEVVEEEENNAQNGLNPDDYDFICPDCKELFNREGNIDADGQIICPDCKAVLNE